MTASLENSSLKFKFAITDVLNIKKKIQKTNKIWFVDQNGSPYQRL